MKIIGHRGAAGLAPENSLAAIKAGIDAGADAIEIDVRLAQDGQFVVIHDSNTRRVATSAMDVATSTVKDITAQRLSNGEAIPTLAEALQAVGTTPLYIEAKDSTWAEQLAQALEQYDYRCDVTVIAINLEELKKFHKLAPTLPVYLVQRFNPIDVSQAMNDARRYGFSGICFNFWLLNPFTYWRAKKCGLEIGVYTVNWGWMARFMWWLFPDIIITSNHPEKLHLIRNSKYLTQS
ncbi:hypothetical protein CR970_00825 [Candidatus Saccharibacteria bacterium]|nr:MAG: hypothetical protein CR970_00825 [Candidatus Saccharibacteria bacterium]